MRVSGRKLRIAVGTGIAALMLTLGVSSVGATAPGAVGNDTRVVVGRDASASQSSNPTVTNTTYRDAVTISRATGAGDLDECVYTETGNRTNAQTINTVDVSGCGFLIIQPAAYPLWEVQTGTPGKNVLVVPPTGVPGNRVFPTKTYVIETFR